MKEEIEQQGVSVFGTNEISVKEFMNGSDKSLMLLSNYDLSKENLVALKNKHEARVEELILLEKLSLGELKELNSIRGELREPRYLIQKIEKNNVSTFESYKKADKANLKELVDINKLLEDKADSKIKIEDDRKKNEKAELERLEREREANLRKSIDDFESDSYKIIQSTTIADVDLNKSMLDALVNKEIDYAEFDILFEQARSRVQNAWDLKCNDIQEKENQRLENQRLEKENAESKRISELQASRLSEILPYIAFAEAVDLTKLSELSDNEYQSVLLAKKCLFEADAKEKQDAKNKLEAENLERENKAKADKEKIFEIRVNRFSEIGMARAFDKFVHAEDVLEISFESVINADAIDFETIITDAKLAIEKAKTEYEESEKQKAKDLETAKADAERLKKENKARVKRLSADKYYLSGTFSKIQDVVLSEITSALFENEETETFRKEVLLKFENLLDQCITELEKL